MSFTQKLMKAATLITGWPLKDSEITAISVYRSDVSCLLQPDGFVKVVRFLKVPRDRLQISESESHVHVDFHHGKTIRVGCCMTKTEAEKFQTLGNSQPRLPRANQKKLMLNPVSE